MLSPRPVPIESLVVKNGSNTLSMRFFGIPGPLSFIVNIILESSLSVVTEIDLDGFSMLFKA